MCACALRPQAYSEACSMHVFCHTLHASVTPAHLYIWLQVDQLDLGYQQGTDRLLLLLLLLHILLILSHTPSMHVYVNMTRAVLYIWLQVDQLDLGYQQGTDRLLLLLLLLLHILLLDSHSDLGVLS